jgi:5-methylcytosine-specific restriction endonuclease McrA
LDGKAGRRIESGYDREESTFMLSQTLRRPTLVLNRSWQPINIATVARALALVYADTARIVDPHDFQQYDWKDWTRLKLSDDEPAIQAVSLRLRIPEVITLVKFDRVPSSHVAFNRRNLFKRDRCTCQYCGRQPASDELTIDHIIPRSQGGQSSWTNCVLACVSCNHRKADRAPDQAGIKLRRKPTRPTWHPVYSRHPVRIQSWSKFISHVYWETELDQ